MRILNIIPALALVAALGTGCSPIVALDDGEPDPNEVCDPESPEYDPEIECEWGEGGWTIIGGTP